MVKWQANYKPNVFNIYITITTTSAKKMYLFLILRWNLYTRSSWTWRRTLNNNNKCLNIQHVSLSLLQRNTNTVYQWPNYCIWGHPFMTSTRRGGGSGSGGRMWTGRGPAPCGRPHRKLKLESTDVILSSHAKKLASFLPEFRLWTEKKWKFFCDIN